MIAIFFWMTSLIGRVRVCAQCGVRTITFVYNLQKTRRRRARRTTSTWKVVPFESFDWWQSVAYVRTIIGGGGIEKMRRRDVWQQTRSKISNENENCVMNTMRAKRRTNVPAVRSIQLIITQTTTHPEQRERERERGWEWKGESESDWTN